VPSEDKSERRIHPHLNPLPSREGSLARICRGYHVNGFQEESLERLVLEERVSTAFIADSGRRPVAGIDNCFIGQDHELFTDALH
jgi:hypothetical protein